MSRVLVTGGVSPLGAAVVRRLLADPDYEVRVSDRRPAPQWMREGCEIHDGDLRVPREARAALAGCTHVIHLAAADLEMMAGPGTAADLGTPAATVVEDGCDRPYTLIETGAAVMGAVIRAAIDAGVERFVYVSSPAVFELAKTFPTPEDGRARCPVSRSAWAFSLLAGEVCCRAAHEEHGLPCTICRPATAVEGVADEVLAALVGCRA